MKSPARDPYFVPAREAAELYRELFTTIAHELGSVSSALGLRAAALASTVPAADVEALRGLSAQLRDIHRLLRLLQGPRGPSVLAPTKNSTADDWWRLIERLVGSSLPRGVRVQARAQVAIITPSQAYVMTHLVMLACQDLTSRGLLAPASLQLSITPHHAADTGVTVIAELPMEQWPSEHAPRIADRWRCYAVRVADRGRADLRWWIPQDERMQWRCSIGLR